jgi:hypothetical protein
MRNLRHLKTLLGLVGEVVVDEEIIVSCVELSRERQVVKWIDASLTECRVDVSLCPTLRIRASVCLVCGQYMIRGCNGMIALPSSPQCQIWMTDRLIFESSTNSKHVDLREWWLTASRLTASNGCQGFAIVGAFTASGFSCGIGAVSLRLFA